MDEKIFERKMTRRVIYAADKSASTGKPVRLNEFRR
jgi:hypothetical protein